MRHAEHHPVYYFHGFASAIPGDYAESPKIAAVSAWARRRARAFRPQNVDYRVATDRAREILGTIADDVEDVLFCGASMGGWFARILQLLLVRARPGLPVAAVTFNPAFNLAEFAHLLEGPQVNHVTGEAFEWTAAHSRRLAALEAAVDYAADLPYWVYVDRDDEVISAEMSESFHAPIAHFHAFAGGSHSFEHAPQALKDFDRACWPPPRQ